MSAKKILHIDMDAFFASVEQRDDPTLKGKPVIVSEAIGRRSVVASASYEARNLGVRAAMPIWEAKQLCPDGIFLQVRIEVYKTESGKIMNIFREYTDLVQPVALDEAYLDVTVNKKGISSALEIAKEIQARIFAETGLTASAGVSFNMFLAKTASGMNKPSGLTEIRQEDADSFLCSLPIGEFYGVGPVTAGKFLKLGIKNGKDLKGLSLDDLEKGGFGKPGRSLYDLVRGVDNRIVDPNIPIKSVSKESTLEVDTDDIDEIINLICNLSLKVEKELEKENLAGKTVTLKVRYSDFTEITRSMTLEKPVKTCKAISDIAGLDLLPKTEAVTKKIRKIGISVSGFPKPPAPAATAPATPPTSAQGKSRSA